MDEQKNTEGQGRQKNFYTLNLTEGRIFLIFVLILMVTVFIIIGVVFALPDTTADNNLEIPEDQTEVFDMAYYGELEEEDDPLVAEDLQEESTVSETTSLENQETSSQDNDEKNKPDESASDENPNIIIDDSSVLRSSEYSSTKKTETKKVIELSSKKPQTQSGTKNVANNTTEKETKTAKSYQKRYVIQVASYRSMDTLKDIEGYYKSAGYPTYVKATSVDGKTYYRLRVGPFKEKERAEKYLAALKISKYGKDSFISVGYF